MGRKTRQARGLRVSEGEGRVEAVVAGDRAADMKESPTTCTRFSCRRAPHLQTLLVHDQQHQKSIEMTSNRNNRQAERGKNRKNIPQGSA